MTSTVFQSAAWTVGDNINTDLILPIQAYYLPISEQPNWVFSANRPGWSSQVKPGDILVGGANFGVGSSRPAARSLKNLGIACVVAESINGLFYRNAVNFALPALVCPGISAAVTEGDEVEVVLEDFEVRNLTTGRALSALKMPPVLLAILKAGGLYPLLEAEGLIAPAEGLNAGRSETTLSSSPD